MNNKIGIIFDMDGTILNTLDDLVDNVNYVLSYYQFPLRTKEEVRNFVGRGIRVLMEKALPPNLDTNKFEECFELFKKHYSENLQNNTKPYEGIIELLQILKNNDVRMAVVSNKFQQGVEDLNNIFFKDFINVAIGNRDGIKPKPSPESVYMAINELGLDISKDIIYYVGDSDVDIFTAHNAKLPAISVTWGFRTKEELLPNNPDYLIDYPLDILDILKKKTNLF